MKLKNTLPTFLIIVACFLVVGLLYQTEGSQPNNPSEQGVFERIRNSNTIKCGYVEWPGLFNIDPNTGKFSGLFYDYWNMVAKDLGVEIEWAMPVQWGQVTEAVSGKKIDIFCSAVWPNAGRRRNMLLVEPLFYTPMHAYVRLDETRFNSLQDLNQSNVRGTAMDGDSSYEIVSRYFPNSDIVTITASSPYSDIMNYVVHGKSDFFVMDEQEAAIFMARNPDTIKRLSETPVTVKQNQTPLAIGETQLMQTLESINRDYLNDGTLNELIKRYDVKGLVLPNQL